MLVSKKDVLRLCILNGYQYPHCSVRKQVIMSIFSKYLLGEKEGVGVILWWLLYPAFADTKLEGWWHILASIPNLTLNNIFLNLECVRLGSSCLLCFPML